MGEVWGNADQIEANIGHPVVGGLVLFRWTPGHVAVITEVRDKTLSIIEGNYESCQITEREINIDDSGIRGFRYLSQA